jgi:F-type H+-transporting ATPase subunit epsilon
MALQLLVVTPERKVVESEADEVELPGAEGYLGILPGHTPLITLLKTGVLTFKRGGRSQAYAVSSGFAEIANDRVNVLADSAESSGEIDVPAAERQRATAEEEMKTASGETLPEILARFELADARIHAAKRPA